MMYFDCCCEIGPRNAKDPAAPWSAKDVLHWMNRCGIAGALVVHTLSIRDDPVHARRRLAAEIARASDRLFPVWALLPPDGGDFERSPAALLKAMAKMNVRAVKFFPKTHNFPFCPALLGPTLQALEEKRVLTLLDFSELPAGATGAFKTISEILGKFPDLPFLLQRISWAEQRCIAPLMEQHKNLHIEFSTYQVNRGIEEYSKRFGAERLLFGTGIPAMSAGAARAYVDYASLPGAAKEKIAGGNLARLLGGARPAPSRWPAPDALCARAAAGEPIRDWPVLDAHCHVLHEGAHGAGGYVMYHGDADGLLEIKDMIGIKQTALISWAGPAASDPIASNDIVARAVQKYPDRFLGVVYVNPTHLSPEELMAEVRTRVENQGFAGLKPYHYSGLRYDDKRYAPCWEYANEQGLYVLLHLMPDVTGGADVVAELAARYPQAQWVIAHVGSAFNFARSVAGAMKDHPNLWAELTYTTVTNGLIEWMVSEVGDDRILFGTDAPMRDPRPQFGWVAWADIPLESRRRILGENYQRLLSMRL